jgi:hypothetical protein
MRASLLFNLLAAAGVIAVLLSGRGEPPAFALTSANGALSLANSKEGTAILSGKGLRPGARVSGSVTIANTGAGTALALEVTPESETPGRGGDRLWQRLQIKVGGLYQGRLADMGRLHLGELPAGSERAYAIEVSLPGGGNALQNARLSVRFTWLAVEPEASTPEPPPAPPAPEPPAPAPPAAPTAPPAPAVTASQIVKLPAARSCLKRSGVRLRVRAPRGVGVRSVKVTVNGRRAGAVASGNASIALRRLPHRKARLKAAIVLADGRRLSLARTYKTC